jgi:undecaprenyl pyrophosphate phosphatase UppP
MSSHFLVMCLFALLVAAVFGALMKDDAREQLRFGGLVFVAFVVSGLVLGWLMYPFPW